MNLKELNSFINKLTENVINRINEEKLPNGNWKYNNLIIEPDELENTALNWAENYWYDKKNGQRTTSAMREFYDNFGETDSDPMEYEGLFSEYLSLCEKYKNDPEIQAKYEEDYEEDEKLEIFSNPESTKKEIEIEYNLKPGDVQRVINVTKSYMNWDDNEMLNRIKYTFGNMEKSEVKEWIENYIRMYGKNESRKLTSEVIKETIIKPIVERYLLEAEMDFADDDNIVIVNNNEDEIEEATTTSGVGNFAYDAPAFGADQETKRRDFFSGGMRKESQERLHASIKQLVENRLKKKVTINEASLGKELMSHFQKALTNPDLFNDPAWISRHEEIQDDNSNPIKITNSQLLTKIIPKYTNINPDLVKNVGYQRALMLMKGNKHRNDYAVKLTQQLVDMDKELQQNPSLANDSTFMTKYNDLNDKYGNRVALGGKASKRNAGIEKDTVQLVSGIVTRAFNFIANIYKSVGLIFNKEYLWINSKTGKLTNKRPEQDWNSLRVDIYEKLGFEDHMGKLTRIPGMRNDAEVEEVYNIENDSEFLRKLAEILPTWDESELNADEILSQAEDFKERTEYASKKRANANLEGMGDIEMQYNTGG